MNGPSIGVNVSQMGLLLIASAMLGLLGCADSEDKTPNTATQSPSPMATLTTAQPGSPTPSAGAGAQTTLTPSPSYQLGTPAASVEQFKLVGVEMRELSTPPYNCPRTTRVEADVTVEGAGTLTYYWKIWYPWANEVIEKPAETLSFDGSGTKTARSEWEFTKETSEKIGANIPPLYLIVTSPVNRVYQIGVQGFCSP